MPRQTSSWALFVLAAAVAMHAVHTTGRAQVLSARAVREILHGVGAAADARVTVRLKIGVTVRGRLCRIGEDHLLVARTDEKAGAPVRISYGEIERLKRKGKVLDPRAILNAGGAARPACGAPRAPQLDEFTGSKGSLPP